ncbi:hypothetical protein D915_000014 [Fasciola hepatica]|uniref:Uncharacterized protein n=1 Tax=Fasciola hepatica TaxID=6192 RepID=A0A4E0RM68_FASHE|nr:hypothetical protein D915_000014 [Fasciola hepatica]
MTSGLLPVVSADEDLTLTSLTHAPSTTAINPNSPLIQADTNASLGDGTDNPLADLNLSRCTTPISLIQPDSVDLTEFLAAATGDAAQDDDDTEINMDDLFLASAALDSPSAKSLSSLIGRKRPKPGQGELSFDGAPSPDADNSISLPDVCAEEVVSSDVSKGHPQDMIPVDTADLDHIDLDPISDCGSTDMDSVSHCSTRTACGRRVPSPLTTPSHQTNPSERELFGLPWEDKLMNCASGENDDNELNNSLNAGLLPSARVKSLTKNSLKSIKSRTSSRKNQQNTFIVGNEIIPAESAVPFANVSMGDLVQILQPALVPVPTMCPQTVSNTLSTDTIQVTETAPALARTMSSVSTRNSSPSDPVASASPPLIRTKFQPRPVKTLLPRTRASNSTGAKSSPANVATPSASVSSTTCMIPVLPLSTVAFAQPLVAATTHPITLTVPNVSASVSSQPIRGPVRPAVVRAPTVYKKIAPAPRRSARSVVGATPTGTLSDGSNQSAALLNFSAVKR